MTPRKRVAAKETPRPRALARGPVVTLRVVRAEEVLVVDEVAEAPAAVTGGGPAAGQPRAAARPPVAAVSLWYLCTSSRARSW